MIQFLIPYPPKQCWKIGPTSFFDGSMWEGVGENSVHLFFNCLQAFGQDFTYDRFAGSKDVAGCDHT